MMDSGNKISPPINSDSLSSIDSGFMDSSNQSVCSNAASSSKAGSVCSDDIDNLSNDYDPSGIITKAMIEEEEKLHKMSEKELKKIKQAYMLEKQNKELEEKKIQRLNCLLERSQFYSNFAVKKLEQLKDLDNRKKTKRSKKTKNTSDEENSPSPKVRKIEKKTFTKVLAENNEKANTVNLTVNKNIESKVNDCGETRITSLGIHVPASQPKLLIGASLRGYQLEGLNWLKTLFLGGMNGILADEMGLGKTIQIISLICHLYEENVGGPFLIVAPLSTLPNWIQEFETFAPDIPVVLFHGDKQTRSNLCVKVKKSYKLLGNSVKPVVVTSYEIPLKESNFLGSIYWKYIIVDEGHKIKNHNTILARTLSAYKSINRMLLTGTPLQNNLYELWSLLHFLMPEVFDDIDDFHALISAEEIQELDSQDTHLSILEKEKENNFISTLHKILEPFLLRRIKADVNLMLPPKQEKHIHCPLTETQYELYSQTVDRTIYTLVKQNEQVDLVIPDNPDGTRPKRTSRRKFNIDDYQKTLDEKNEDYTNLSASASSQSKKSLSNNDDELDAFYKTRLTMTNVQSMLKKIANHPYLVRKLVIPGTNILQIDERLITSSGKMMVLDSLLQRLKQNNHKVLIFSTYTMILDLLESFMEMRNHRFVRLDGSTKIEDRKIFIKEFNTDPDIFAFLISTRAGGLGINLTAADTVIIFDSDWNPQVDLQAQDRCHRIGQSKPVIIFRLISSGTIDDKIVTRADAKRKLEKVIIGAGGFKQKSLVGNKTNLQVSLESLKELLNEKNYSVEVHPNGSVLTDEEWEKLLDRSF